MAALMSEVLGRTVAFRQQSVADVEPCAAPWGIRSSPLRAAPTVVLAPQLPPPDGAPGIPTARARVGSQSCPPLPRTTDQRGDDGHLGVLKCTDTRHRLAHAELCKTRANRSRPTTTAVVPGGAPHAMAHRPSGRWHDDPLVQWPATAMHEATTHRVRLRSRTPYTSPTRALTC